MYKDFALALHLQPWVNIFPKKTFFPYAVLGLNFSKNVPFFVDSYRLSKTLTTTALWHENGHIHVFNACQDRNGFYFLLLNFAIFLFVCFHFSPSFQNLPKSGHTFPQCLSCMHFPPCLSCKKEKYSLLFAQWQWTTYVHYKEL